jgi:hypothetical protein
VSLAAILGRVRLDECLPLKLRHNIAAACSLLLVAHYSAPALAKNAEVIILDDNPYHVHAPGEVFSIGVQVNYTGHGNISYQWRDFTGKPLSDRVRLTPRHFNKVPSPRSDIGYYGLHFASDDPDVVFNRTSGLRTEVGFAILSAILPRDLKPESYFGLVHARPSDPYQHPGYIKTMMVRNWSGAGDWMAKTSSRRAKGLLEVPINASATWRVGSDSPVTQTQLDKLYGQMRKVFSADPAVLYWELGLEENLKEDAFGPFQWANTAEKFRVVRNAADQVNPDIKLIYQIEGFNYDWMQAFFESKAAKHVDILSLHPYKWPDFPSPEEWLENHLNRTRTLMRASNTEFPIWFTEVGAPHHGTPNPNAFFGYEKTGARVTGTSRRNGAVYLVKMCVMAIALGVQKVFWYNYRDRGPSVSNPEHHFGLMDHWGHPKPAYAAYSNIVRHLEGKKPSGNLRLPGNIWVYRFTGPNETCVVTWVYPAGEQDLDLSALGPGVKPSQIESVIDTTGTPLALTTRSSIRVNSNPVFLLLKH